MANKMHLINCVFDIGTEPNIIREDFFEAEWFRAIQANNRSVSKNETDRMGRVLGIASLQVRIGDFKVRVAFGVVGGLTVLVLLGTSFIDGFVKVIFPLERNQVPYNSRPVPILANKDMSENDNHIEKDKAHVVWSTKTLGQYSSVDHGLRHHLCNLEQGI